MVEDAKNLDSPIDPGSTPESVSDEAPETTIESNLGEDATTIEAQGETNTDTQIKPLTRRSMTRPSMVPN